MSKMVSGIFLIIFLFGMFAFAFKIQLARAQSATIYINNDGSISPFNAPISTVDRVTYTFTGNVSYPTYNGIVIERSFIVIDGAGYTLQGNQSGNGLSLNGMTNVTIENANIENFQTGISLSDSDNNTVSGNNVTANSYAGIALESSSNNTVSGNTVTANSEDGIYLYDSSYNTVSGNNVTANSYAGIALESSSNNTVNGNNVTANSNYGIYLYPSGLGGFSNDNIVSGNNATANGDGIYLDGLYSPSNSIPVSSNTISGNNVTANSFIGIWLSSSSSNIVSGNIATANGRDGIFLYNSSSNTFSSNNITANSENGMHLYGSSNNYIYLNNFIGNANQTSVDPTSVGNAWDNGYPPVGNYWSNYETKYPNASENDNSGIWNTHYIIDANNTDQSPLMNPVVIPEFQPFLLLPLFVIMTLLAVATHRKTRPHPKIGTAKQQHG